MRELMRRLAAYVMRGILPAIGVVAFAALIALLLQPLTLIFVYVSGASLALVTLRRGWQSGIQVLLGALLLTALLAGLVLGNPFGLVVANLIYWLPVWLCAVVLRQTIRLDQALQAGVLFGLVLIALAYGLAGDPAAWWAANLKTVFASLASEGGPDLSAQVAVLARWMTAVASAGLVLGVLLSVLLGRWWQSLLYNPGGFGEEFRQLRLGLPTAVFAIVLLLMGFFWQGTAGRMAADGLMVVSVGLLLQGLAVVHALAYQRKRHVGWLVALYLLLLLAGLQVAPLLALLGLIDNLFRFRGRAAD